MVDYDKACKRNPLNPVLHSLPAAALKGFHQATLGFEQALLLDPTDSGAIEGQKRTLQRIRWQGTTVACAYVPGSSCQQRAPSLKHGAGSRR